MSSINEFCVHPDEHTNLIQPNVVDVDSLSCNACDCPISGKTYYQCSACNSSLHPFCKASPNHLSSPLHPIPDHPLTLLPRAPIHRQCTICNDVITGVHYTCSPCHLDLHPQCTQLPPLLHHLPQTDHALVLQIGYDVINDDCIECGDPCGRWAYRCFECKVSLHFWCLAPGQEIEQGDPTTTPTATATPRGIFRRIRQRESGEGSSDGDARRGGSVRYIGVLATSVVKSVAVNFIIDVLVNMV